MCQKMIKFHGQIDESIEPKRFFNWGEIELWPSRDFIKHELRLHEILNLRLIRLAYHQDKKGILTCLRFYFEYSEGNYIEHTFGNDQGKQLKTVELGMINKIIIYTNLSGFFTALNID